MNIFLRSLNTILLSVLCLSIYGQEWILQNPFSRVGTVNDLEIESNGVGYAVGGDGLILKTTNAGDIWEGREPPLITYYTTVEIMDNTNGAIALVGGQKLLRTTDYGETWERIQSNLSNINGIRSVNETTVFLSTIQNGLHKSVDGGETFTQMNAPEEDYSDIFFYDEMKGWALGRFSDNNKIIKTMDGGETWSVYSEGFSFLNRIHFATDLIGYATSGGGVLKTIDGGETWNILADSPTSNTDLFVLNEDVLWVTWGLVYQYSLDGGQTWSERDSPQLNGSTQCVFLSDENTVWVAGRNITIGQSVDGGMTWSDQIPASKAALISVDFYDDQLGYAAGGGEDVLITTNGGAIWETVKIDNEPIPTEIRVIDQNRVMLSGRDGMFLSVDQGRTWSNLEQATDDWVESFEYINDNNIVLGTAIGTIRKMDINGNGLRDVFQSASGINKIDFVNATKGWAVNRDGEIYHSVDGGESWSLQFESAEDEELTGIHFINETTGFVLGRYVDYILKTEDGGMTWVQKDLGFPTFRGGVHFINENTGWVVGGSATTGSILVTNDGGETWESDFGRSTSFQDVHAPVSDQKLAWAVGAGGLITRFALCNINPSLTTLNTPTTVCKNDVISVEVGFEGIDIFEWTVPMGWNIVGNNTSSRVDVSVGDNAGIISVIGMNSCEDMTAPLTHEFMTPLDNPDATITQDGDELRSETVGEAYQWYLDGEEIEGATEVSFLPIATGDYYVRITHQNDCVSPPSNIINITISSTTHVDNRGIKLYPNPASHAFYLEGILASDRIELWSVSGQLIRRYDSSSSAYNLSSIPEGLYILQIKSNKESGYLKLIVGQD